MPTFNRRSIERLETCHPDLQRLFFEVIKGYDCTVLCGIRSKPDQDQAVREGKSKLPWPKSKHNLAPSMAVDVVPYPIDWNQRERFYHFAGYVQATADRLGIKIRWGGDWNSNIQFNDESFIDTPHFELLT